MKFGTDYASCRANFLSTAESAGVTVAHHVHPALPDAAVDVITLGNGPEIRAIVSGAHGVELPFGSAVQCAVLDERIQVPDNATLVLIHAINCYGAVHRRRFTDGNIDLCRNFATPPHATNTFYEVLAPHINASPENAPEADTALASQQASMGPDFIAGIMGGQFDDPAGFSYGGAEPTWSRQVLEHILEPLAHRAESAMVLDLHTGVGPFAEPTFVCLQTGAALARARALFGNDLIAPLDRTDTGTALHPAVGHPTEGYERLFANVPVTSVVLEMGTYPPQETLPVLIQEHRYHRHGLADGTAAHEIRQRMWEQHAPADEDWQRRAREAGIDAVTRLLRSTG